MTNKRTDVLVMGSGIAGLTFALKTARYFPDAKVTIITKDNESESNTKYAQGGIAVVEDFKKDSFKKHIKDTVKAGDGLCNPQIVELVVKDGPDRLKELIAWGSAFDKKNTGEFDLRREGGHSADRIVHHKDITGLEIERTLLSLVYDTPNIELLTHQFAIDLITEDFNENNTPNAICHGAYMLNLSTGKINRIVARIALLATGGAGQVYLNTTNSHISTGDGIVMAYNAGCKIENMEFIQFHPTMLYHPKDKSTFLISETVRGAGAVLKTKAGKTFMEKYDRRGSLAPRDIVARAIESEMKSRCEKHVCLDCRMLDKSEFTKHFLNIFSKCSEIGIDITKDMIPVVPTAHYMCGGIKTDINGQTSIKNLYACGECASTGLHGANRLASNSLLEALVFAHRCYSDVIFKLEKIVFPKHIPAYENSTYPFSSKKKYSDVTADLVKLYLRKYRKKLQFTMSKYAAIYRTNTGLKNALRKTKMLLNGIASCRFDYSETTKISNTLKTFLELRNISITSYIIVKSALMRKESRGLHYNVDKPNKSPKSLNTIITKK